MTARRRAIWCLIVCFCGTVALTVLTIAPVAAQVSDITQWEVEAIPGGEIGTVQRCDHALRAGDDFPLSVGVVTNVRIDANHPDRGSCLKEYWASTMFTVGPEPTRVGIACSTPHTVVSQAREPPYSLAHAEFRLEGWVPKTEVPAGLNDLSTSAADWEEGDHHAVVQCGFLKSTHGDGQEPGETTPPNATVCLQPARYVVAASFRVKATAYAGWIPAADAPGDAKVALTVGRSGAGLESPEAALFAFNVLGTCG